MDQLNYKRLQQDVTATLSLVRIIPKNPPLLFICLHLDFIRNEIRDKLSTLFFSKLKFKKFKVYTFSQGFRRDRVKKKKRRANKMAQTNAKKQKCQWINQTGRLFFLYIFLILIENSIDHIGGPRSSIAILSYRSR